MGSNSKIDTQHLEDLVGATYLVRDKYCSRRAQTVHCLHQHDKTLQVLPQFPFPIRFEIGTLKDRVEVQSSSIV